MPLNRTTNKAMLLVECASPRPEAGGKNGSQANNYRPEGGNDDLGLKDKFSCSSIASLSSLIDTQRGAPRWGKPIAKPSRGRSMHEIQQMRRGGRKIFMADI